MPGVSEATAFSQLVPAEAGPCLLRRLVQWPASRGGVSEASHILRTIQEVTGWQKKTFAVEWRFCLLGVSAGRPASLFLPSMVLSPGPLN